MKKIFFLRVKKLIFPFIYCYSIWMNDKDKLKFKPFTLAKKTTTKQNKNTYKLQTTSFRFLKIVNKILHEKDFLIENRKKNEALTKNRTSTLPACIHYCNNNKKIWKFYFIIYFSSFSYSLIFRSLDLFEWANFWKMCSSTPYHAIPPSKVLKNLAL